MVGGGFPKLVGSGGAGPGALTAGGLGGGPIINAFLEETAPDDPGATLILRMVIFSVAVVIRSRRQLRITQDVLPAIHVSSCHKHSHYGVLAAFCGSLG